MCAVATARAMMEDVLLHWDHLKRVEFSVNRCIRDDMVGSVLERRFLDSVRHIEAKIAARSTSSLSAECWQR